MALLEITPSLPGGSAPESTGLAAWEAGASGPREDKAGLSRLLRCLHAHTNTHTHPAQGPLPRPAQPSAWPQPWAFIARGPARCHPQAPAGLQAGLGRGLWSPPGDPVASHFMWGTYVLVHASQMETEEVHTGQTRQHLLLSRHCWGRRVFPGHPSQ